MLNVYHSNNMELLKELTIQLIKNNPLQNIFEQEKILVQSTGISQWLKIGLAEEFGITANIRFPLPATFLWEMFNIVIPDLPKESAFSKDSMTWKIMKLLPELIDTEDFLPIRTYLENDKSGVKSYQLSEKIADLYDQYSVFRPEWIDEWERGKWDDKIIKQHKWQPILWKHLVDYTKKLGQSHFHRANMYEHFLRKVTTGNFPKENLPSRLFIVGISSLPPRFLDALEALSLHMDIHLMFANPCQFFWGDIKDRKYLAKIASKQRKLIGTTNFSPIDSCLNNKHYIKQDMLLDGAVGNSLLASMGKTGRDYLSLLSDRNSDEIDAFVEIDRDSLLHNIQCDILNLVDKSGLENFKSNDNKIHINKNDRSVTINSCFSIQRELEALHDYLLHQFNNNNELKPQDVVVMVADIEKYSPHIHSVFGGVGYERYIPYSVSDRAESSENPVLQVFLNLLSIAINRQESSKIMEILEVPLIMRKFEIDEGELSYLSTWIEESGIRWGLDEQTSLDNGLPISKRNHWEFGLNRMILGYSIPESKGDFSGVLPYNECQGKSAEAAGKLGFFIDELITLRNDLSVDHTIEDWIQIINVLIDNFFDITNDEEDSVTVIRSKVSDLFNVASSAKYSKLISADIIFKHFNSIFGKEHLSQHFLIGKVTFCTLMPMRNIPFAKVCLLGMNDGAYPRATNPEGFDLMAANPQLGDRSRRDDDRYLFLEAMLSASKSLYISYIGKKIQDGSQKSPSVLVSELIEYIGENYCLEDNYDSSPENAESAIINNISVNHPLSSFSPLSFTGENASFAKEWIKASTVSSEKRFKALNVFLEKPLDNILLSESKHYKEIDLDLNELLRFWSLPVKHFFTRRLKVNFEIKSGLTNDEEAFDLDAKSAFPLKKQWLDTLIKQLNESQQSPESIYNEIFEQIQHQFNLNGVLPSDGFGRACLLDSREKIENIAHLVSPFIDKQEDHSIDLEFYYDDGRKIKLTGWSRRVYSTSSVYYRAGSLRPQDIMQAWIQHLSLCASGISKSAHIFTATENVEINPLNKIDAYELLKELIDGYQKGMCIPLPFLPRSSIAALKAGYDKDSGSYFDFNDNKNSIIDAISKTFINEFKPKFSEKNNPYISRIWSEITEEVSSEIYNFALKYLAPSVSRLIYIE